MKLPKWFCHQIPNRCLTIKGIKMPLCSRCCALYIGILLGLILSLIWDIPYLFSIKQLSVIYAIMITPIALDGMTQLLRLRESNHFLRIMTGSLAGLICGVGIHFLLLN